MQGPMLTAMVRADSTAAVVRRDTIPPVHKSWQKRMCKVLATRDFLEKPK